MHGLSAEARVSGGAFRRPRLDDERAADEAYPEMREAALVEVVGKIEGELFIEERLGS